jgi:hypothetical protein
MIELNNVEIISINTHMPENSVKAIKYSCEDIRFNNKKIFSHRLPQNISDDIQFVEIPKFIERRDYSEFVLKHLYKYIDSDYVLTIHDDGFIINPHLWNDDFLKYDYIGAPWPGEIGQNEGRVGNGGFCLKSKRLVDFFKDIDCESGHDDWTIGVIYYKFLKENGFKIAPVEIAMKFSLESVIRECDFDLNNTFGFHGRRHPSTESKINILNNIE